MIVLGLFVGGLGDPLDVRLLYAVTALLTLLLGLMAAALPGLKTDGTPESVEPPEGAVLAKG